MHLPRLTLTIRAIFGVPGLGAALVAHAAAPAAEEELPPLYVSATAFQEDAERIAASFSVLEGAALQERTQPTLGDTLNGIPGVHSDTFGGGATRPVIRGQGAPRVKVLSDSASLLDASDISPDHAVTAEPLLLDRIEVLRGPATLLYGSGAIGGVVNVLDHKIPEALPAAPLSGSLAARGSTVSSEEAIAAELTARAGSHFAVHAEGAFRDADDYRAPGLDEPHADGTRARSANGSVGFSWVGEDGFLGLAYSHRSDDYGLPGHSHEYEACHPHDSTLHCEAHDEEHEHEEGESGHEHEVPMIDLRSRRMDLRGEIRGPVAGIERIRLRMSHTDYRHHELEEEEIATTFLNKGVEGRIEVQHAPLGSWHGVAGLQYADTKFSALGEEAFIPVTRSRSTGLFVVEHLELDEAWHFELGARHEWQRHRPQNDERSRPAFSGSATSLSGAAIWEFVPDYHLTLSVARSERMPQAQELYARGIHMATNTYECGLVPHPLTCGGLGNNADLRQERSNNAELSLRRTRGSLTFSLGYYYNQVDNYVYARTLDQFEAFRLIKYTQHDARFRGFEAEATWRANSNFAATVFGDYVRATLDAGGNLPRTPPGRIGVRLNADVASYGGELEFSRVAKQKDFASYEAATPGYDMLNLTVSYALPNRLSLYARGSNLLNEQAWNHASFLAGVVPLRGRSLDVGARLSF